MFLLEFWLRESLWSPVFPAGRTLASQKAVNVSERFGTGLLFVRVVGGSGRVCVCEDYLPSSPSGSGSCREKKKKRERKKERQIKNLWGIFTACYQRLRRGQDDEEKAGSPRSPWGNIGRDWSITRFLHALISLLTFSHFCLSLCLDLLLSLTLFFFFLFISISKTRVLVTQALLFGLQVNHQWMEARSCGRCWLSDVTLK